MGGFYDAIQCKECGKIYWDGRCCNAPPYYCNRCGAALFRKGLKDVPIYKGSCFTEAKEVTVLNHEKAKKVVAKKVLFWWKVRKEGDDDTLPLDALLWTSVNDELPIIKDGDWKSDNVFVCIRHGQRSRVSVGWYSKLDRWSIVGVVGFHSTCSPEAVTHWMPIPKLPETEE